MKHYYLWLDLETTGTNPAKDQILEVAYLITHPKLDHTYAEGSTVIRVPHWRTLADDYVRDMHEKSGLAKEIEKTSFTLEEVEHLLVNTVGMLNDVDTMDDPDKEDSRFYLAGSSIHFDRGFVKLHMPRLENLLHYRMLDVSTLKLAFGPHGLPKPNKAHRAADDLQESIDVLRHYRKTIPYDSTGYD